MDSAQHALFLGDLAKGQCNMLLPCIWVFKAMHNKLTKFGRQVAGGNKMNWHSSVLAMI
jgi:hypothetical protein